VRGEKGNAGAVHVFVRRRYVVYVVSFKWRGFEGSRLRGVDGGRPSDRNRRRL